MKFCKYLTIIIFLLAVTSCSKQDHKYSMKAVDGNNLTISGLEDVYTVPVTDTLKIEPNVSNADGTPIDTSLYDALWLQMTYNSGSKIAQYKAIDTIVGKKFILPITFDKYLTGTSIWVYRIVNKRTGIFTQKQFQITTYNVTSEGYYVLSQTGSNDSKLGMIYYDFGKKAYDTATNILQRMYSVQGIPNAYTLKGTPTAVTYGTTYMSNFLDNISVITSGGAIMLDPAKLFPYKKTPSDSSAADFYSLFKGVVSNYTANQINSYATSNGFGLINYNNSIFVDNGLNFSGFSNPLIRPGSTTPVKGSKWIVYKDNYKSITYPSFILYDDEQQSFYLSKTGNISSFAIQGYTEHKKLLYMHYTDYGNGRVYAVLQSNNNDSTYLLSFDFDGNFFAYRALSASRINANTHFAISSVYGYLFYNIGTDVYEYDITKNQHILMSSYTGKEISYMEGPQIPYNINAAQRTIDLSQQLVIATYDPAKIANSGTVDFYDIPAANGQIVKKNSYSGFGKVVSMTYKQDKN